MAAAAGIDTWSVAWYVGDGHADERAMIGAATGRVGRFSKLPEDVAGHRILFDREHRLVMAEGHPAADGLARFDGDQLEAVRDAIADGLIERGVPIRKAGQRFESLPSRGFAGIRRLDTAVDVQRPREVGRAILQGIAAIEPPGRLRSSIHRAERGHAIETVSWEGASGKVARAYDKGVESGSHPRGERVRLEDQRRFPRGARPHPEDVASGLAAMMFQHRFRPLRKAMKGVVVTSVRGAVQRIEQLVRDGELSPAQGKKLLGHLVLEREGVELGSRTTRWRHRSEARDLGVVLAGGPLDEVEVDLAYEVDTALEEVGFDGT